MNQQNHLFFYYFFKSCEKVRKSVKLSHKQTIFCAYSKCAVTGALKIAQSGFFHYDSEGLQFRQGPSFG